MFLFSRKQMRSLLRYKDEDKFDGFEYLNEFHVIRMLSYTCTIKVNFFY